MTRTANATEKMKRDSLIAAAAAQGTPILCAICGRPIIPGQRYAFDHGHAVGRDGPNEAENLFPVHAEARGTEDGAGNLIDCHDKKTFRPRGGATTLGGDNYEAKKTPRLGGKHSVNKPAPKRREKNLDADRVSLPSRRCRRCGGPPKECICKPRAKRSGFGQRRAA